MRHYCSLLFELFGAWLAHRARTEWAIPGEVEGALILKPQSIIETMPFILKFRISGSPGTDRERESQAEVSQRRYGVGL